jgi:hypothetical protein
MATFHIVFSSDLHRVPVESVMLVEARVFRSDDSMLKSGRSGSAKRIRIVRDMACCESML